MAEQTQHIPDASGQPLWLAGLRGHTARQRAFEYYVSSHGVTGAVWTPSAARPDDWTPALHRVVEAGAAPDESLLHDFALTDVRTAAESLRFVWRDSGHVDGWAVLWLAPERLVDIARATEYASGVVAESARPNVAVGFAWSQARAGLVSALVARDVTLALSDVRDATSSEQVERARAKGMERARGQAGEDGEDGDIEERAIFVLGGESGGHEWLRPVRLANEDALLHPAAVESRADVPASQEQERSAFQGAVASLARTAAAPERDDEATPVEFAAEVERDCRVLSSRDLGLQLWSRDHTLWKPEPDEIADRLGWLDVPRDMRSQCDDLVAFGRRVRGEGITRVVLCGMGGSSLAPEVLASVLPTQIPLTVLDSTDPDHIASFDATFDAAHTLVVVASKSGTTVETLSHLEHLWARSGGGQRFVAITDPGTPLADLARQRSFLRVFENPPDIGGRFSGLSYFGLVPAAICGIDVARVLDAAVDMRARCAASVPGEVNPGVRLGAALGEAFGMERDKLTFVLPPRLVPFGAWLEQLVAESTGKEETGVLPVSGEVLGAPDVYDGDRFFVAYAQGADPFDPGLIGLEDEHPIVRIRVPGPEAIGAEFFRWEFATAVLGHVLEINPFDQPDVESAKRLARESLDGAPLGEGVGGAASAVEALREVRAPGYLAVQAFIAPTEEHERRLHAVRRRLRDRLKVAVTVGFGPRFLHSTGQYHKGGPNRGTFLQITASHASDVPVPGKPYTFGGLIDAQADGDFRALRNTGRRVVRLSLEELERLSASQLGENGT